MAGEYTSKKIIITATENGEKKYCSPWVRPASTTEAGVVMVDGSTITINNGVISASGTSYTLPTASTLIKGGVKIDGDTIKITDETISADFSTLQTKITSTNKLSADLLSAGTTNKLVTQTEKSTWNGKQDKIDDLSDIRTNATAGAGAATTIAGYGDIVSHDASEFQEAGDYADAVHTHTKSEITDFPTIPTVNNKTITIQKNSTTVDTFTLNQSTNKTINITVPTSAADVSALPASTKYAKSIDLSVNTTTFVVTAQLKDQDGNNLGTAGTIDLPLESTVVGGSYNNTTKKVILTLRSGDTIEFSVADLISGLQSEITSTNKLSADLIADGTTNKVVTATEKNTWNNKQASISDLSTIRTNATAGANAATTISGYGDIVSHDADEFALADHTHSQYSTTDTKNTAGTSNKTGTKMFLAAATSQGANPQTYSNSNCYIGTDNCLYSGGVKVLTAHQSLSGYVPTSRTVNGKALSANITLSASDVGALPADTVIPAAVTETTVSGWGFTKNAGTITGIKMNGASKGTSGVVDLGTVLTAHQTVKVNGVTGATTNNFGTCSTAAGTAAKTVTLTAGTFALETGARVLVKFTVTNTAANPTLNVGGTGAKAIQYRGSAISTGYLAANRTYEFVYDGTNYQLVGDINTDTNNVTAQNISTADNTYPILLGNTANATANIGNKATLFGSGIKANPSTSTIVATTFDGNATSATTASKLGTADKGSATQPIYLAAGVPTACTYTLAKSVPSDAKFTDTVYTHPTTSGNKHIPSGGSANQVLVYSSDGTAVWGAIPSHTHSEYFAKNSVISGATDWNTLTTFGCYKIQNTTMTAEYNAPAGEYAHGLLLVYRIGTDNENRIGQTYYPHQPNSGAVLWARMQNGTNWTDWKKVQQSQISKGSATKPVYFNASGNAVECTYELNKTVPSDAKFTDTVYTHPTTAGNKHIPSGGSSGQILKYSASGTAVWANEYSYTHPTTSGNKHIPSGGSSGQFLKWSADGTATWAADNNTKNTAGTSNKTGTKMFLAAATEQSANPQTYSNSNCYIGTDNCLYSNGSKVLTSVPSHNQASSTINAMTSYSKASAEASIATSDSLNTAIGKVEYKVDNVDTQLQALIAILDAAS